MLAFQLIAERKISQAINEGRLQDAQDKWRGRPLVHEDDSFVPQDLKMAYKILKNSGFVPQELLDRQEVNRLEELIASCEDEQQRLRQMKKLDLLLMKMDIKGTRRQSLTSHDEYYRKVVEKVEVRRQG